MLAPALPEEYLEEIRRQVCAHCVERPPGGPPCLPLGKPCGVELHLPQIVAAIREVHSPLVEPYLANNRSKICQHCAFLHSSHCPCPMDYLAVLLVEAVETVDRRRDAVEEPKSAPSAEAAEAVTLEDIVQAYNEAAGRWTGCDWPTAFGTGRLDLNGWTSARAEARAASTTDWMEGEDWDAAVGWLTRVEQHAAKAEAEAALAVAAAKAGDWNSAATHARRTRSLELSTGRPFRLGGLLTWGPLCRLIEAARHSWATATRLFA
jgi:hypothetical protein